MRRAWTGPDRQIARTVKESRPLPRGGRAGRSRNKGKNVVGHQQDNGRPDTPATYSGRHATKAKRSRNSAKLPTSANWIPIHKATAFTRTARAAFAGGAMAKGFRLSRTELTMIASTINWLAPTQSQAWRARQAGDVMVATPGPAFSAQPMLPCCWSSIKIRPAPLDQRMARRRPIPHSPRQATLASQRPVVPSSPKRPCLNR